MEFSKMCCVQRLVAEDTVDREELHGPELLTLALPVSTQKKEIDVYISKYQNIIENKMWYLIDAGQLTSRARRYSIWALMAVVCVRRMFFFASHSCQS